ncbi:hypothetical protein [Sphaerisporangium aureirubrum]|uniref:Uncharacterized protein n=1 Tax=Sphaerisporangium aureirubrum TaxID=1544736 RepID=A0ABW1ND49_9ACTN
MLTTRILGEDLPSITTSHPLFYSGNYRQSRDAHIAVGVRDVTPGDHFGYDWKCSVIAYPAWNPGRHGTSCRVCAEMDPSLDLVPQCPAGAECGHLQDGEYYNESWGQVFVKRFMVLTSADTLVGRRFDPNELTAAVQAGDAALTALPPSPLPWTAYGPSHEYGHWATEREARGWLAGHMGRLAKDRNLGDERQQVAAACAAQLADGAEEVAVGSKVYGIRHRVLVTAA